MDPFANIAAAQAEASDTQIKERLGEFFDSLPDDFKAFILAKMQEDDTGEMPMPPPRPMGLMP